MSADPNADAVSAISTLIIVLFFYVLPSIIALSRKRSNAGAIIALNLLLGWTMIGWVVCLVWALTTPSPSSVIYVDASGPRRGARGGWVPRDLPPGSPPAPIPTGGSGVSAPRHDPTPRFDRSDRPRPAKARRS